MGILRLLRRWTRRRGIDWGDYVFSWFSLIDRIADQIATAIRAMFRISHFSLSSMTRRIGLNKTVSMPAAIARNRLYPPRE